MSGHLIFRLPVLVFITVFLSACVSTGPRALNPRGHEEPSLAQHGVVAMSLDMVNEFNKEWGPWKLGGRFSGKVYDVEKKEEVDLEASLTYFPGPLVGIGDGIKEGRNDMSAIMILPAGTYRLTAIIGSSMPGVIGAGIHFPVFSDSFRVEPGKGIYIGHVGIVAKEKTAADQVSLDQMVGSLRELGNTSFVGQVPAKFSKTTPVLTVSNRFDSTIKELKEDYPYLKGVEFQNRPIAISLTALEQTAR